MIANTQADRKRIAMIDIHHEMPDMTATQRTQIRRTILVDDVWRRHANVWKDLAQIPVQYAATDIPEFADGIVKRLFVHIVRLHAVEPGEMRPGSIVRRKINQNHQPEQIRRNRQDDNFAFLDFGQIVQRRNIAGIFR